MIRGPHIFPYLKHKIASENPKALDSSLLKKTTLEDRHDFLK